MKPYRGRYRHPVNPLTNCKVTRIFQPAGLNLHLKYSVAQEVQRAMDKVFTMTSSTPTGLAQARTPFEFKSAAHLLFIEREQATNLEELSQSLRTCPDASIFQHTFRTLEEHHYIKEGFSNDFAQWAYTDLREVGLGERLAALDVREFTSLERLRVYRNMISSTSRSGYFSLHRAPMRSCFHRL